MKQGNWIERIVVLSLCLATCACGGGGDHVASVSGTATGTATSYDSFAGLNKNVTLSTSSSAVSYRRDTINGASSVSRDAKGGFGDGGITISFDATSQTYTLHDGSNAISYAPADKTTGSGDITQSPFDTYVRQNGKVTDTISAYRVGGANTQFPQLSYTTFGIAQRSTVTGGTGISQQLSDERLIYSVGGFETQHSDLPKTGTASYTTYVTGSAFDASGRLAGYFNGPRTIGGSATLTADFGAASVNTALALTADGKSIGSFSGVAPIESTTSHFKGDLTGGGATQGTFAGSFFGPQATEAGYTFRVQTSIGTADGGVVGKK